MMEAGLSSWMEGRDCSRLLIDPDALLIASSVELAVPAEDGFDMGMFFRV